MFIYAYKQGSASAKALAEALGIKRIKREDSKFKGALNKVVVNWGNSDYPKEIYKCNVVNKAHAVSIAANKLQAFVAMSETGVRVPTFSVSGAKADDWVKQGKTVVCRTVLNGHSGEGIVIATKQEEIVDAKLYVQYVPKKQEYRIHIFNGEVLDVQRKARNKEVPDDQVNWQIRNHQNGFIFAREKEAVGEVPEDVFVQSKAAVEACGLHFGAVDVIYNEKEQKAYVLEVNTAPGITGTTLENYVNKFKELM